MKKRAFVLPVVLFAVFFLFAAPALACEHYPGQAAAHDLKGTYVARGFVRRWYRQPRRPAFKGVLFSEDGSEEITAKDIEAIRREFEALQKEIDILHSTTPADPAYSAVPVPDEEPAHEEPMPGGSLGAFARQYDL